LAQSGHRLLTVPEAAEQLHISRVSLYELIRSGQLPSLKIGKSRRIPASALGRFVAERTQPGLGGGAA
jgi:excisionase family DNA binding protein